MTDPHRDMLANRLRRNERRLKSWRLQQGVTCYRVYTRDIPEIPLIIERWDDAVQVATVFRPDEQERAATTPWLTELLNTIGETLDVPGDRIFLKHRRRQRGQAQYNRVSAAGVTRTVREAGLLFEVNLSDYLDTGLFLDHRPLRRRVAEQAAGRDVLNLFCYTGSFTVAAGAGGARSTTSVDLSNTYLDWAARNLELNRERCSAPGRGTADGTLEHHRLVRADVSGWLRDQTRQRWDIILCDPPSFSNSKATDDVLDIQADHVALIELAGSRLTDDGVLYFSTNRRGFRLDRDGLAHWDIEDITSWSIDADFAKQRPHQAWRIRARA